VTGEIAGSDGPGSEHGSGQVPRAEVSVRPATVADVPEIARIQVETWRIAYAALLPPGVLDAATQDRASAEWTAAIADPPSPRHRVLVAREQQWTVGFVAFGPFDEGGDPPGTGIVHTLLVEPRWGRRGHGSRLLAAAVDHLRPDGSIRAVVWLVDGDAASTAFYRSTGWQPDGTVRTLADDGAPALREVRFHVSLEEGEA
jgi:GNAT superfamily N-acetyltransferase